jgi:hypothetical protein
MTTKRTINHQQYNPTELAELAISIETPAQSDLDQAVRERGYHGVTAESIEKQNSMAAFFGKPIQSYSELVTAYALELARLSALGRLTGANFIGQHGRWNWNSVESVTAEIDAYLNRRNAGRRSRWNK